MLYYNRFAICNMYKFEYAKWLDNPKMVQLVEYMTCDHEVAGSSPAFGTKLVWPCPSRHL